MRTDLLRNNFAKNNGFSMMEVLVSLAVLAIGMLGVGLYVANALRATSHNQLAETALFAATRIFEPFYGGSSVSKQAIADFIARFPVNDAQTRTMTITTNLSRDTATIQLGAVIDGSGRDLLTTTDPSSLWVSPVSFGILVSYPDAAGNTHTERIPYTFMTPS